MKLAIIGVTGMVGATMLDVLKEKKFPFTELYLAASKNSQGKIISVDSKKHKIISVEEVLSKRPNIALFSAGSDLSLKWAKKFTEIGTFVIDNSSAWRKTKPLIVPEINSHLLEVKEKIIANPNCSTIQLVMVLKPLHDLFKLKRVVVSTYQSFTGTGKIAVDQYENEMRGIHVVEPAYPHQIFNNVLPHCDLFEDNNYTKEEMKLANETTKIMGLDKLLVSATAVRVPAFGGHSESVNIEFEKDFNISEVREKLNSQNGVVVLDNPSKNTYPMPIHASGKNDVFVGRIRRDFTQKNTLNLWIVSDNLRKGAATNAVQIAELLISKNLFKK